MNPSLNLAFIDFETTGFSPKKGDRIVEGAVISTDWNGNVLGQSISEIYLNRTINLTFHKAFKSKAYS
jgi:oligoribonuclease (3'-5' exoribonuclease)